MAHTYMTIYENEYRSIEILIRDMCEEDFNPDTATAHIEDNEGETIVEETTCMVVANKIRVIVPTTVTNVKGLYNIIWTVIKDGNTFKHKTILNVEELT